MSSSNNSRRPQTALRESGVQDARPVVHQHAAEIQPFGKIARLPIALAYSTAEPSRANSLRARSSQ